MGRPFCFSVLYPQRRFNAEEQLNLFLERTQLIPQIRIKADVEVTMRKDNKSIADLMHRESAGADAVLLGLATPEGGEEESTADRLAVKIQNLLF